MSLLNWMVAGTVGLTVGMTAFAHGNGGGYNGPDWAGQSVPVSVDRAVTRVELKSAVETCVKRVTEELVRQVLRDDSYEFPAKPNGSPVDGFYTYGRIEWPFETERDRFGVYVRHEDGKGKKVEFNLGQSTASKNTWNGVTTWFLGRLWVEFQQPVRSTLELDEGLPQFIYETEVADGGYDDFGNAKPESTIIKDLELRFPKNYGSSVALLNKASQKPDGTYQPSNLKINMEKYAACLVAEIQK